MKAQILERFIFAEPDGRACASCADGEFRLELERYSPFVGRDGYPEREYSQPLAADPETGHTLTLRRGCYGCYVERDRDGDAQAARDTVPAGMDTAESTAARALLALPRTVGGLAR